MMNADQTPSETTAGSSCASQEADDKKRAKPVQFIPGSSFGHHPRLPRTKTTRRARGNFTLTCPARPLLISAPLGQPGRTLSPAPSSA